MDLITKFKYNDLVDDSDIKYNYDEYKEKYNWVIYLTENYKGFNPGDIIIAKDSETNEVICYDEFKDDWLSIKDVILK